MNKLIRIFSKFGGILYGKPTRSLPHLLWISALLFLFAGIAYLFR